MYWLLMNVLEAQFDSEPDFGSISASCATLYEKKGCIYSTQVFGNLAV